MASNHRAGDEKGSSSGKRNRRSTSDLSSVIKEWTFANGNRPWKARSHGAETTLPIGSNNNAGNLPSSTDPGVAHSLYKLRKHAIKVRNAAKNASYVDSAWNDYAKKKERCFDWCRELMAPSLAASPAAAILPKPPRPPRPGHQKHLSFDSLNLVTLDTGSSIQSSSSHNDSPSRFYSHDEECQEAVLGWETAVDLLAQSLRTSLQETYNDWDKDATPEGFERICWDKTARHNTISRMRSASLARARSVNPDIFPKYDARFRNYDEIQKDLSRVHSLLSTSGIPQERTVVEQRISSEGDVMLEFPNIESEKHPVFRFRVSSHCLRETSSPIFSHMFKSPFLSDLDDDIRRSLPPPPTRHVCADGSEVLLYRMPQIELNTSRSLEILLHAAHNHDGRVPRKVHFNQFVAITETCLRYRCTSPLEIAVEHMWLPYWRDKATDDMLAGVLLISYVFGLAENFTRLSKLAILHMTDQYHLQSRAWPPKVQAQISAVRNAKMQQVYEQCRSTLNEYLRPAAAPEVLIESPSSSIERFPRNQSTRLRCPRGDSTCDAQNLGWFMKRLAELDILPAVLPCAPAFPHVVPPERSLQELMNALCAMPSPPPLHQHHDMNNSSSSRSGICDFTLAFRAAIRDIYASVQGLTLAEVSMTGKRFWALSKRRNREPEHDRDPDDVMINNASQEEGHEQLFEIATRERCAPGDGSDSTMRDGGDSHGAAVFFRSRGGSADTTNTATTTNTAGEIANSVRYRDGDDAVYFGILSLLTDPRDLRAAALVDQSFYRSYKRHEKELLNSGGWGNIPNATAVVTATAAVSPREKFRYGEVLLMQDNKNKESDGDRNKDGNKFLAGGRNDKFAADVREQFLVGSPRRRTAGEAQQQQQQQLQRRSMPTQGRDRQLERDGDAWLMNGWI